MYPANMFKNVKPIKLHVVMFVFGIIATWFFAEALSLSNQNPKTLLMKKVLLSEPTKNVVYSPFSANIILALLASAGDPSSTTTNDLVSLLPDNFSNKIKSLTSYIKNDERQQVTLDTKVLSRNPASITQQYVQVMTSYNASVGNLNYFSARRINRWAKRITKGNLKQLMNDDDIDGARLVMINILFFQAKWLTPFTESFNGEFSVTDNLVKVSYMEQTRDLYYHFDENLEIVLLTYEGFTYSMMILLPKMGGLEALIEKIDDNQISQWQRKLEHDEIEFIMPKFKFSSKIDLKEVLTAAGKQSIFAGNFNKLGSEVRLSGLFQKAGISVDERGTEAYSATAAGLVPYSYVEVKRCFVNRPFLFLILETNTDEIMFAGKVINPNLSD